MKKLLLLLVLTITSTQLFAQYGEFYFGAKVGTNISNVAAENDTKAVARLSIGGTAEYRINRFVGVGAELLYGGTGIAQMESVRNEQNQLVNDEVHYNFNSLSLPVLAKIYVTKQISIEGGVQLNTALYAKRNYRGEKETIERDDYDGFELGIPVGVSYNSDGGFVLGARMILPTSTNYVGIKNKTINIFLGWKF